MDQEVDENLLLLGLEIFQFVSMLTMSEGLQDKENHFDLLINCVMQFFNKKNEWKSFQFA